MRLAVVFVALTSSLAFAAPKVPLRVVRVLPETNQALLFDKAKGTHVLAEVGQIVEGFTVEDIADDEVTLASSAGTEVVLAAPAPRSRPDKPEVKPAAPATTSKEAQPEDPYADPPVRAVEAPATVAAGEAGVRVAEAPAPAPAPVAVPAPAPTAVPVTVTVTVPTAAATVTPAVATPAPAPAAAPANTDTTIPRAEFKAAIADFGKLANALQASFTGNGVRIDSVAEGSLFARVGLRAGDVVRAVDNQPLRSLDDAADLYARAGTARNMTVQVVRGSKPLTLRVMIQ